MLFTLARRSTLTPVAREMLESVSLGVTTHFDTHPLAPPDGAGFVEGVVSVLGFVVGPGVVGCADEFGWVEGWSDELAEGDGAGVPAPPGEGLAEPEGEGLGAALLGAALGEGLDTGLELGEGLGVVVTLLLGAAVTAGLAGAKLCPKPVATAVPTVPSPMTPRQMPPAAINPMAPRPPSEPRAR